MEVEVEDEIELFDQILTVAALAKSEGLPLRLIGGAAMQLWGNSLSEARTMTKDLDWALMAKDLSDEATAKQRLERLVPKLRALGFERPRDWKPSRSGRFQFQRLEGNVDVEFLCGDLPFGRPSRRGPAYELFQLDEGEDPPAFYAAKTPWIDKVDPWLPVQVRGTARVSEVWIPSIPSLALLKLKAVRDKLERVGDEQEEVRVKFECGRLQRHGNDFLTLLRWAEARGEFVDVTARVRGDLEIGAVALESERRLNEIDPQLVREHEELRNGVRRLARSASSSPS